jgi:hypothetical protein
VYLARGKYEDWPEVPIYGVDKRKHNKDYYQNARPATVAHEVGHYVDNYQFYEPVTEGNGKLTNHENFKSSFNVNYTRGIFGN